jgi:hypothetical protein
MSVSRTSFQSVADFAIETREYTVTLGALHLPNRCVGERPA